MSTRTGHGQAWRATKQRSILLRKPICDPTPAPEPGSVKKRLGVPRGDGPTPSWRQSSPGSGGRGADLRVGRYHLIERLGRGSQGEVWKAVQLEPPVELVALKLLLPAGRRDREVRSVPPRGRAGGAAGQPVDPADLRVRTGRRDRLLRHAAGRRLRPERSP